MAMTTEDSDPTVPRPGMLVAWSVGLGIWLVAMGCLALFF
jgi:hypothetical protein